MKRRLVRLGAPAAFLLAATIAVLLVRSGLRADNDDRPAGTTVARTTFTPSRTTTTTRPTRTPPVRTYTVEAGDTLDQIALELDTTVEELLALNPGVEATELRVGQRLRVP